MPARKLAGRAIARTRRAVVARYGPACQRCGILLTDENGNPLRDYAGGTEPHYPTLEHVIPQSLDGTHDIDNLRLQCKRCNSARGNRMPTDPQPSTARWLA